ncbi:MAG: hypothetical protein JXR86_06975, partial [Spirochaetales bacterium]|nr:hypothetical protein [Spirochaetales bacterium]
MIYSQSSRIPGESENWLQVTGATANGDPDGIQVVFFEVNDSITDTLYFAVRDPGTDTTYPDTGGTGTTDFYLIGGSGTLSDPLSRLVYFSATNFPGIWTNEPAASNATYSRIGNQLAHFSASNESEYNDGWVYFPGVNPNQGEHIGNKYYFKVTVDAPDGNGSKNAFQLAVNTTNSGDPPISGISGVRSFAYSWNGAFGNSAGRTWELYPYVPNGTEGSNIRIRNWDFDGSETIALDSKTGLNNYSVTPGGNNTLTDEAFAINAAQSYGTWTLTITEDNAGTDPNTSEIWALNNGYTENYRTYSDSYTPNLPDHVVLSYEDGIATVADNSDTEKITLVYVDISDDAAPYVGDIYVTVDGNGLIYEQSDPADPQNPIAVGATTTLVSTDSSGMATIWVTTSTAVTGTVNVNVFTNSSNGSTDIGAGTDDTITIDFVTDYYPSISSTGNDSFTQGDPDNSAMAEAIVISNFSTAAGYRINSINNLMIRIPSGLGMTFDTGNSMTVGVGQDLDVTGTGVVTGAASVTYSDSGTGADKTMTIPVTTDFDAGDILTISNLQFDSILTASTGSLEISWDGGSSWASDDKIITITPFTVSRETVDTDNNGYIDAVRLILNKNYDDSTFIAGEFDVVGVTGEAFDTETTVDDKIFLITFNDDVLSSGTTPNVIYSGSSSLLLDGTTMPVHSGTAADKAEPVILSVVLSDGDGTAAAGVGDKISFNYSEALDPDSITNDLVGANVNNSLAAGSGDITGSLADIISELGSFATTTNVTADATTLEMSTNGRTVTVTLGGTIGGGTTEPGGNFTTVAMAKDLYDNLLVSSTVASSGSWDGSGIFTWLGTGAAPNNWNATDNWNQGTVPDGGGEIVVIPAVTNFPILDNFSPTIASLTIDSGAELTVSDTYSLTISSAFDNQGTLFKEGSGSVSLTDTDSGLTVYQTTTGTIELYAGTDYYDLELNGVNFSTAGDLSVAGDCTVTSSNLTLGGALSVSGTLDVSTAGTLTVGDNDVTVSTLTLSTGTSVVDASGQTTTRTLTVTGNATGSGTLTGGSGVIDINGDLTVSAVTGSSGTTYVGGNFSSVLFPNTGTIVFDGSASVSISNTGSFYDLVINKDVLGTIVTSTSGWTVDNSITLSTGTWVAGAFTHLIAGDWDSTSTDFSFTETGSTIQLTSSNPTLTTGGLSDPFVNLTLDNGGTLGSDVAVTGVFSHESATVLGGVDQTLQVNNATLGSDITMTGAGSIEFTGAGSVTLSADSDIIATEGYINFDNPVDGAFALTANAGGTTGVLDVSAALGTSLTGASLTGFQINLDANITTNSGNVSFIGAVDLGTDVTIDTGAGVGNISFSSTIDGGQALVVNSGNGLTTFSGIVGGSTALTSLTTDANGTTTLTGNVTTSGAQTYNDAVTIAANTVL